KSANIVHAQTVFGLLNLLGFMTLKGSGMTSKLVVTSHGVPRYNSIATWLGSKWWNAMMREMGRSSRAVTTVASSSVPILKSLGIGEEKIRYIPNGVDGRVFRKSENLRRETRLRLGIGENEVVVMSLGDLRPAKGVLVFLGAVPRILRKCDN